MQGRFTSLDAMRGIAVMGILLMNVIAFSMPGEAYINPRAWGGTTTADIWTWATMFVLVDGKMRGLFSLLFGASMLLVYERAEAAGADGRVVHRNRMLWLLVFGLVHGSLIWFGDILAIYALCGMVAVAFVHEDEPSLLRIGIGLIAASWIIWCVAVWSIFSDLPSVPDADAIAADLAAYRGSFRDAVAHRNGEQELTTRLLILTASFIETIGLFVLGMAMFRSGFLTGMWEKSRYAGIMWRCYLVGLPALAFIAIWCFWSGFSVSAMTISETMLAPPFRTTVIIGHAALAMIAIKHFHGTAMMARITATGRVAFSNYIGTSLVMTTLFYGHGFGQFGYWSRAQVYLLVPFVWVLMLLWSKPWLDRCRYGPLEWLWRSLARGQFQTMRVTSRPPKILERD
jgi:uncharacterized protein